MKKILSKVRKKRYIIYIFIFLLFLLYLYNYVDRNIKPTLIAVAEVRAKSVTTKAINDTIKSKIKEDINYENLILVKYDLEGRVSLMQANTILMNSIAADMALEVQEQLKNLSNSKVKVPLSNTFNRYLINLPSLNLQIQPQGSVNVGFATEFEEAGINQTRHRIYLIVSTDIRIIVPLISKTINITTNIPIAETVIIGDVPEQYFTIPSKEYLDILR
ncbi:MAG: sporulation protein YunB [Tissierellaceae bacterium]|nr:sporulation protein YunB [Tissierellaceae bacterium]